ncbi:MAG: asparagine synthase-related protein [Acidobacteriota bacterium]
MTDTPSTHAPLANRLPDRPIARVLDLTDPARQMLFDLDVDAARQRMLDGDLDAVRRLGGSFALIARDGTRICLARSLDRPLRYFLAKEAAGPMLIVAERIDAIRDALVAEGYGDQFHPSYTRMVPAHHVTTLQLVGCPDPNPVHARFFAPPRADGPTDLDALGARYVGALLDEVRAWLGWLPADAPIGVAFSGGIDSGAVLLATYYAMRDLGLSPARLKAFTLRVADPSVDGAVDAADDGGDLAQAQRFLDALELGFLLEPIEIAPADLDPDAAIAVIEDYKPRDVECATVGLALLRAVRARYPDWRFLVDGDGGDENLKDYPIEENPELTIRSVVNNSMLYQEGWGVEAIKHSLVYSGGQSRGCVRTYAPAAALGFAGFSPLTRPAVIAAAESIPFAQLTGGDHAALYALKGEIVQRGVRQHLGVEMPIFPKRRFQHGATPADVFAARFGDEATYRQRFLALHGLA